MAFLSVIIGEILDSLQGDETAANVTHTHRSDEAREVDDREWADHQTTDIHEWLQAPDEVDFTPVDTPAFASGTYDPSKEFTARE